MPLIFSRRLTLASISYAANTVLDIFSALLHWISTMVFLSLSVRAIIKCTYRWEIWYLLRLRVRVVLNYLNPLINFYLQLLKEIWMWRGWGVNQESHIDGARIIKACASSSSALYLDPNLFRGSLEIFGHSYSVPEEPKVSQIFYPPVQFFWFLSEASCSSVDNGFNVWCRDCFVSC